jgi:transcription termination factor Rho
MNNTERAETALIKGLRQTNSNEEFLIRSAKKAQASDYVDSL